MSAKKVFKISLLVFVVLAIGFGSLISYVKFALPNVGEPEDITISASKEQIERGKYLAHAVTVCMDCHSVRDWTKFSAPLVEGTLGQGGETFDQKFGFPGAYYSKNITPFGIGTWTDGELLRAISSGVNKEGKALFPLMPHPNYGRMDKEDLLAIIAYLRTLSPIENTVKESSSDFPMNIIINTIPKKAEFSKIPDHKDQLAYGQYLFNAAACNECHTKQDKGAPIEGMTAAGGFEFPLPSGGIVRSANITQDKETGIGNWSEGAFVARFKMYSDSSYTHRTVAQGEFNTVMPWTMYANMTEEDLKAIFLYMKTIKPVTNKVLNFEASK